MSDKAEKLLFELAETQDGFFTAAQAYEIGFSEESHTYWVKTGKWERMHRGIFRLADYPEVPHPELMTWYLWSKGQGVFSHEAAMAQHQLIPDYPPRMSLTVPRDFPKLEYDLELLKLYFDPLLRNDVCIVNKVKTTTPVRTLVDVIIEGEMPPEIIRDAIYMCLHRKLIDSEERLFLYPKIVEDPVLEKKVRRYLEEAS